jgi:hypothetical protein
MATTDARTVRNISRVAAASMALALVVHGGSSARAAAAGETQPPPANTPPADTDVSGVLVPEPETGSPARGLMVVPQAAVGVVVVPVRGGLTVYERYRLRERMVDLFFNDARTFGIYPSVSFETGLPAGVGLRLVHKDLFGLGARMRLAADYRGEARHRLEGGFTSPAFAGGLLRLKLGGGWQRQPNARFFGVGDADLARSDDAAYALPARSPFAFDTRFGQQIAHGDLGVEIDLPGPLFAAVSTAYYDRGFIGSAIDDPTAPPSSSELGRTDVRFDTSTLTGWAQGTRISYSELALGWNSLAAASTLVPTHAPSRGTKVVAFAGLARSVGAGGNVAYTRYGLDAVTYLDLYRGDRVLILRGRLEGVMGSESEIPFTDLPRLGGPSLLRGYARDRFRDRVSLLGSIEYRYPIWEELSGYLFVDAGRVLPGLEDLGQAAKSPGLLRAGGGGGLEVMSIDRFLLRAQVAGSPEGFFFQLALDPVYRMPTQHHRI